MGMKSVDTARKIPLAEAPNIAAAIHKIKKLPIESITLAPVNHLPECQHCHMSHFHNGARTFEIGTHPLATPTAKAAKLAAPDSKINPCALQRAVAHRATTPPSSTAA
jgi:hypothetical protein